MNTTDSSVLLAGAFYIDTLAQLAEYPAEDTKVPSLATEERRGGNAANSATVLAQFPNRRVFIVSPMGDIAKSQKVPELTLDELKNAYRLTYEKVQSTMSSSLDDVRKEDWRNVSNIIAFAKWLRGLRDTTSMLLPPCCISQEFESPTRVGLDAMLPLVDVALFSRLYAENYLPNTSDATTFLKHISKQCRPGALLFCTWGGSGVYSCRVPRMESGAMPDPQVIHTPARQWNGKEAALASAAVIDPVGAGDTFTAAIIHRLVSRLPSLSSTAAAADDDDHDGIQWRGGGENAMLSAALTGCNLAGRKVTQMGFEGLGRAWMNTDEQMEATEPFNQEIE
ncbi:Ribokinase-like protein [Syncephalis plumigaleata]|nr:Ribokinase-like protein [Syncephalis plumigaleata]